MSSGTVPGMSPKSFLLDEALHRYLVEHGTPPDEHQAALIERTTALGDVAGMQIAPEQGALLTLLTRLVGTTRAVEVGTFTGYSALAIARGLDEGGRLLCCDVNEEWTSIASEAWAKAGVADRIELRLDPALETLRSLPPDPTVDLAFVDADKPSYVAYHEELVPRLRPGGLLLVDNTLWAGRVVDPAADDDNTTAIRAYNDHAATDDRVDTVLLPVADGLTLCRRR
jgi:caffeoyl-CoA O-methyltransferase